MIESMAVESPMINKGQFALKVDPSGQFVSVFYEGYYIGCRYFRFAAGKGDILPYWESNVPKEIRTKAISLIEDLEQQKLKALNQLRQQRQDAFRRFKGDDDKDAA